MSSDFEKGERGNIKISGRRNIHSHPGCPFQNSEAMGRYGLGIDTRHRQGRGNISQEGTDEVDNVISKLARASTPITTRKDYRRSSLNSPDKPRQNLIHDSDDDSYMLSKSSPAILSLYSCCSEEAEGANITDFTNESINSLSQNGSNQSRTIDNNDLAHVGRNLDSNLNRQESPKTYTKNLLFVPVAIALIGIAYYIFFTTKEETSAIIYDKLSFYSDVKDVGNKYKVSDNSILQVRAGISTIFEKQDTGSFIFPYNGGRRDFNSVNFNNFVNELASAAARYLRNHTKTIHHVVVDTNNLKVQSDEELMREYIEDVDKTGVMLVKDLDRLPPAVAMAFHYYCDEFNPLVKKSAIFFTLNISKCSNMSSEKYTHKVIEKCLAEKWITMSQDNIGPLLTRVVSVIIDVTNDF